MRAQWRRFVTWLRALFLEPLDSGVAMPKYHERGRDARTGRFIPVALARRRKRSAVVERVKKAR